MVKTNNTVVDKNFKKLSIQISLNGLSFCCSDLLTNQIYSTHSIDFKNYPKNFTIENAIWKTFLDHSELTKDYDEIVVVHENNLNTFVPTPFFDEDYKGSYLQYNTKVFETDYFSFDTIDQQEMVNVYVPYVNVNNYLIDQFGTFEYKHCSSVLISKLLEASKNIDSEKMYVHVGSNHFEIIVIQNHQLQLYNTFEYKTADDFLYYLLFTAEQLHLNPETFKLILLGNISEDSELYKKAYQYIRNIEFFSTTDLEEKNTFSSTDNRKNFILFHS